MLPHGKTVALLVTIAALFSTQGIRTESPRLASDPVSACYADSLKNTERLAEIACLAGPFAKQTLRAAQKAHISAKLVAAVMQVESGARPNAARLVSPAGAVGPMQLMPATAWHVLHVNPWNTQQNIDGGAKYLAFLLQEFRGDEHLALMAYDAGPTVIAQGLRPKVAVAYAHRVLRLVGSV